MKDDHVQKPGLVIVSGIHLAEIRIMMLTNPAAADTVGKVLELKGVASLETLDGLSVQNLLQYLRSL